MKTALNGNLILKPYTKTRELETTQAATGFAMTKQKVGIESLELLFDSLVQIGNNTKWIGKGTKVYFKEETLYSQAWARKVFESEAFLKVLSLAKLTMFSLLKKTRKNEK
jgi:hypothetical protein